MIGMKLYAHIMKIYVKKYKKYKEDTSSLLKSMDIID